MTSYIHAKTHAHVSVNCFLINRYVYICISPARELNRQLNCIGRIVLCNDLTSWRVNRYWSTSYDNGQY